MGIITYGVRGSWLRKTTRGIQTTQDNLNLQEDRFMLRLSRRNQREDGNQGGPGEVGKEGGGDIMGYGVQEGNQTMCSWKSLRVGYIDDFINTYIIWEELGCNLFLGDIAVCKEGGKGLGGDILKARNCLGRRTPGFVILLEWYLARPLRLIMLLSLPGKEESRQLNQG